MAKRFEKAIEYTAKYGRLLKPCKYCGDTDIQICSTRTLTFGNSQNAWSVACRTRACNCTGDYAKVRDAIVRWNEIN